MEYNPNATPNERWMNDELQFMRLLGEMAQQIELTPEQYDAIAESMDLTTEQIDQLLERASGAWGRVPRRHAVKGTLT
jgi:hypothetical protein